MDLCGPGGMSGDLAAHAGALVGDIGFARPRESATEGDTLGLRDRAHARVHVCVNACSHVACKSIRRCKSVCKPIVMYVQIMRDHVGTSATGRGRKWMCGRRCGFIQGGPN